VKRVFFWVAVALAVLAVVYLGVGLLIAARVSAPDRQPAGHTPADVGLEYREVSFESTDGVPLAAWWVPPEDGDSSRAAVLVHGWGGDKSDRYALETAHIYSRAGYGVLLLDLRGHGGSSGERRTLGYEEPRDVRGALAWLVRGGFEPEGVVLHGWSMGGATVVRSAPGTGVAAVIEEAGYADLPLLLKNRDGPSRLFNPGAFLAARLFLGFDPRAVRPAEDAARLRGEGVPLFVIHSTSDETVPFKHAELFLAVHPEAELWRLEGYGHGGAYTHPEYEERLTLFLESSGL
jgi:pimeloyl-ACP methyl ester carboxylesterase